MISKTIGFRGTLFSDTPILRSKHVQVQMEENTPEDIATFRAQRAKELELQVEQTGNSSVGVLHWKPGETNGDYPLVMTNIAIENCHL